MRRGNRGMRNRQDVDLVGKRLYTAAEGRRFAALALVPPHLVTKWSKECHLTLPGVRVFLVDGVRNGVGSNGFTGINEVG